MPQTIFQVITPYIDADALNWTLPALMVICIAVVAGWREPSLRSNIDDAAAAANDADADAKGHAAAAAVVEGAGATGDNAAVYHAL
jgi:hypothetical protein